MTKRFIRRGVSKILFSPVPPLDKDNVTRAELTAAEDITEQVAEIAGFMLENQTVATPDMGSAFEGSIPGTDQASNSSLTLYEDEDDDEYETMLPKGQTGTVFILRKGDKPGSNSMDVFPIRVASKSSSLTVANEAARFVVQCTITDPPALDRTIPALAGVAPVLTSLAPSSVPAAGNDSVLVTGVGFTGVTAVTVGGTPLASADYTVVSSTKIAIVAPPHAAGAVPVTVTTAGGTSASVNLTYT